MKKTIEITLSDRMFGEIKNILLIFRNTRLSNVHEMLVRKGISNDLYAELPIADLQTGHLISDCCITAPQGSYTLTSRQFMAMGKLLFAIRKADVAATSSVIKEWDASLPEASRIVNP